MSTSATLKKIGFMIAALATLAAFTASAAVAPIATVGTISAGGAAYTGGSLYYQFNLNSTAAGTLIVKATLTGGKWKPTIPVLTNATIVVGNNAIKSQSIAIPADFVGTATLKLTITLNKKPIVVKPVTLTINPQGSLSVNLYDVGFGNSVVLNGAGISTVGMGTTPTFSWTQQANSLGHMAPGMLSANNVVAPTLTTGPLTDFVDMSEKFGTPGIVGLDNEQVTESTYVYRVLVSGNSITRTGTFTVVCAVQSPARPNIPVGVTAFYKNATNSVSWSLQTKPSSSTATLTHTNESIAQLKPDVEGVYVIRDNVTGKLVTNNAASYVGWTGTLGASCDTCHGPGNSLHNVDIVTPWSQTGHASMAQHGINGQLSPYYNESCFPCHTLGYNQAASAASNGNFKAVANQVGWHFPTVLTNTNFGAMPQKLQNLANIQCESCHGPGSRHPGQASITLDVQVCASCHQDGHFHIHVAQWENGPHSSGYKEVSESDGPLGLNAGCARCHSPNGFQDVTKRIDGLMAQGTNAAAAQIVSGNATNLALGTGPLTCQTCHDPHDKFGDSERHQLRIYDTVVIGDLANPGYITYSNMGPSAACMICHNSRRLPMQMSGGQPRYKGIRSGLVGGPHESPVAEVFMGVGVVDYGIQMGDSFHTYLAECQSCHMYKLRAPDSKGVPQDTVLIGTNLTPVTAALYEDLRNLVGDHSFSVESKYVQNGVTNKVQDIAACNQCHTEPVTTFDFKAVNAEDYDGNGQIEGIQTETQGLLNRVQSLLATTGLQASTNAAGLVEGFFSAGLSTNAVIKDAQLKAAWNWLMIYRDHSLGVHNTQFTIRTLQTTWTDLSTNWTGSVTNTFSKTFPNAYLR